MLQAVADGASTAADVARVAGLHDNMARRHLTALADLDMVGVTLAAVGRGRPSKRHAVTEVGLTALAADDSSDEYLTLTAAFAQHLVAHSSRPSAEAREIGRTWGGILAARRSTSQAPPQGQVIELLEGLRFSPQPRDDGVIALRTCPLLEAAREHPEVVCQVHLGLVQGASAAYGGTADGASLEPFAEPGCCRLRLPVSRHLTLEEAKLLEPDGPPARAASQPQ